MGEDSLTGNPPSIAQVALDVPVDRLFDYRNLDATDADLGRRVQVPFGRGEAWGVLVGLAESSPVPSAQLRMLRSIDRAIEPLAADVLQTLRFAAAYYQYPLGAALAVALPPVGGAGAPRAARPAAWSLTSDGRAHLAGLNPGTARARHRLLTRLEAAGSMPDVDLTAGTDGPSVRRLLQQCLQQGWIEAAPGAVTDEGHGAAASASRTPATMPRTPNPAQAQAIASLVAGLGRFSVALLHGVTGSGKTTVYLEAMRRAIAGGAQALLLVPEINLTPQLEAELASQLAGTRIAVLHSALAPRARRDRWQAAARGDADVVVGTRLAAFTPLPRLGLVIIDEEHDGSYKQEEGLRYHARDVMVWRARARGVPVVLGSATPSLESLHNADRGRYAMLRLPDRASGALPKIGLIDLRQEPRGRHRIPGPSATLLAALGRQLDRGEQSLVLLNRRGFAPVVRCNACGWVAGCDRCSARMVLHRRAHALRCHHCGRESAPPAHCPECGNADLATIGLGGERLEEALAARLPGARVLRVDRDTMRNPGDWTAARRRVQDGDVDILLGTQMLAKGHDFPTLTLVGVIDADSLLYSSDFRAPERLFALLTQVSGRAGRGDRPGQVLIETAVPEHPLFAALIAHDFDAFARELLDERRRLGLPPWGSQAILRADAPAAEAALGFLARAAACAAGLDAEVEVYDPVPAVMAMRAGRARAQLLVQSSRRGALQAFLAAWRGRLEALRRGTVRWVIDVDPLEL
jgi:primosomal protein N' (replication factor Y)